MTCQRPIPSADCFADEVDSLSEYHIHGLSVANRFDCSFYRHGWCLKIVLSFACFVDQIDVR